MCNSLEPSRNSLFSCFISKPSERYKLLSILKTLIFFSCCYFRKRKRKRTYMSIDIIQVPCKTVFLLKSEPVVSGLRKAVWLAGFNTKEIISRITTYRSKRHWTFGKGKNKTFVWHAIFHTFLVRRPLVCSKYKHNRVSRANRLESLAPRSSRPSELTSSPSWLEPRTFSFNCPREADRSRSASSTYGTSESGGG